MKKIFQTLFLLSLLLLKINCQGTPQPFTSTDITNLVNEHNKCRANVNPPAGNMQTISWSSTLQTTAQNYANNCTSSDGILLSHNPNRGTDVGENIYATTGGPQADPVQATDDWDSESANYDYSKNYCEGAPYNYLTNPNWGSCGHYTQLVWATTTQVGCGRVYCPNLQYPYNIVCDYYTAGNIADGSGNIGLPYVEAATTAAQQTTASQQTTQQQQQQQTTQQATPNSSSPVNTSSAKNSNAGTIAGAVIGVILGLVLIGAVIFAVFFFLQKRRNSSYSTPQTIKMEAVPSSPNSPAMYPKSPSNLNSPVMAPNLPSSIQPRVPPNPPSNAQPRIPPNPASKAQFSVGSTVQAQYSGDGKYYKAVIVDFKNGQYLVQYPEYANSQEWRPANSIRP
jgi:hypothetical protein